MVSAFVFMGSGRVSACVCAFPCYFVVSFVSSFCFILVYLLDCFLEGGYGVGRVRWEGSEGGDWDILYENNSFQET